MNITHIRNATQIIDYAGKRFLIDPMLADKGAWPGFPGTARSELRNPLVELPFSRDKIIDVDAVIVTHTHDDHWDAAAIAAIPKTLPVFVQHEADAALLRNPGISGSAPAVGRQRICRRASAENHLRAAWQRPHLRGAGDG